MNKKVKQIPVLLILLFAFIFWNFKPDEIEINSWHTLIIFLFTIAGIIFNVMPSGAVGFFGITAFAITGAAGASSSTKAIMDALSGFNSYLIWLVVIAFFIAKGFIKTGLGRRVALIMVKYFGKKTLGLVYSLSLTDILFAPVTPSNTARCGSILYPIASSLSKSFKSYPNNESRKKIGSYLILSIGNINDITATMFVTAYVANPLIVSLANGYGVDLSWGDWFLAALGPAIVSLIFIPILLYFIMKPEIKETPGATVFAEKELIKMGPISKDEIIMCFTFLGIIIFWIFGKYLDMNITTIALFGLSVIIYSGILTWDDIKNEKAAWDTLIWFSSLLMMANFLDKLGFTLWLGNLIGEKLEFMVNVHWIITLIVLNSLYTYIHYLFASGIAQVAALDAVFLGVGTKLGIPIYPLALMLGFSSSLYCSLTQYSHAKGPILFGSGYVSSKEWWLSGFLVNIVNQIIYIIVGLAWWKMVGFY